MKRNEGCDYYLKSRSSKAFPCLYFHIGVNLLERMLFNIIKNEFGESHETF